MNQSETTRNRWGINQESLRIDQKTSSFWRSFNSTHDFFMGMFTPAKQFDNLTTKYLFLITLRESRWYRACNLRRIRCSLVTIFFSLFTFTTLINDRESMSENSNRFLYDSGLFQAYAWSMPRAVSCFITYATILSLTFKSIV